MESRLNFQAVLSYNSIVLMKRSNEFRGFNGSSRFEGSYDNYEFQRKQSSKKLSKLAKANKVRTAKEYQTNKNKLKGRIWAYFNLKQSKKFSAFYSVSFPEGMPDKSAVKVLNNVLTSIRKNSIKFQYIWVAERQKNGTIHFHILINRYLPIRLTNGRFALAIRKEIANSKLYQMEYDWRKYNGCDVKRVYNSKGIKGYITKYISKNEDSFSVRSWACDRVTSSLFISVSCMQGELMNLSNMVQVYPDGGLVIFKMDYADYIPLKYLNTMPQMKYLHKVNQDIADNYERLLIRSQEANIQEEVEKELNNIQLELSHDFRY